MYLTTFNYLKNGENSRKFKRETVRISFDHRLLNYNAKREKKLLPKTVNIYIW